MPSIKKLSFPLLGFLAVAAVPALAGWSFSSGPLPNAFLQSGNMTLELQCDRMRFAPAAFADSRDILNKQGLSIRFMKNGATEVGAFQVGPQNASLRIVDDYPVEIGFRDSSDYDFILDRISANTALKLSMIDQDMTYGLFDLQGSAAAVKSLRSICGANGSGTAGVPEGVAYCGGGEVERRIEYRILEKPDGQWDAVVTVNGKEIRAMTAYSFFGKSRPPTGFVVALLGEDYSEFLVFRDSGKDWLEFGDDRYDRCNQVRARVETRALFTGSR